MSRSVGAVEYECVGWTDKLGVSEVVVVLEEMQKKFMGVWWARRGAREGFMCAVVASMLGVWWARRSRPERSENWTAS